MIDLKIINKDMEMLGKKNFNSKNLNKDNGKDFLDILENQKFDIKKTENINTDDLKLNKEKKVQQKEARETENKVKTEKLIGKDNKIEEDRNEEDIKDELLVLVNSIYDLILELDVELEELNLEPLKLEIEQLSVELEQLFNDDSLSSDEDYMLEIIERFEDLISSFDKEISKFNSDSKDKSIDLSKELLSELNEIKDNFKLIIDNTSMAMKEDYINFEDEENELNLNNVESTEIEFEEVLDKEKDISIQKEQDVEIDDAKETQVEDIDNNNPLFEIVNRSKIHEKPEIKNSELSKLQEFDKKEVIEQIVNKAKLIVDDYKQEIKIKLKPEILGELMLRMEIQKESVLAKIMVDNYRTKELIEANLYQLKQDMKENGLEIKTFEVFVGNNEDFERENRQEFNFKRKQTKLKVKNKEIKEIQMYDENTIGNIQDVYEEGSLNLFA